MSSKPAEKLVGQPFIALSIAALDACIGNPNALQLYATLCRYVNRERLAWPGQYRLAKDLGVSRRTLQRTLSDLKELGLVHTSETREVAGTYGELVYYVALSPERSVHRASLAAHGSVHRAPNPGAKSVADQLDPNELDPVQTHVEKPIEEGPARSATEQYLREHPELRPEPPLPGRKRRQGRDRHAGHVFCGSAFCVDPEKHGKFERRLRAAGAADLSKYDLKGMYKEFDDEFEEFGTTDHPALYLEKRFSAALREEFGDQPVSA